MSGTQFSPNGSTGNQKRYLLANGQPIALWDNGTLYFLLGDHLASTSITASTSGSRVAEVRYKACPLRCAAGVLRKGEDRYTYGITPTTRKYTGQQEEAGLGVFTRRVSTSRI